MAAGTTAIMTAATKMNTPLTKANTMVAGLTGSAVIARSIKIGSDLFINQVEKASSSLEDSSGLPSPSEITDTTNWTANSSL